MLPINNFVSYHGFTIKMLVKIIVCHEDITGKRGGENVAGMSILPFSSGVFMFWLENPSLLTF